MASKILSALAAIAAVFLFGWNRGKKDERQRAELGKAIATKRAGDVEKKLSEMDDHDIRARAQRWVRDDE